MEGEVVYSIPEENMQNVMSDRVQSMARNIYQEFQRLIQKYDEDVVKELMPNVVNILECLDLAYTSNQEHEVELELLREDNEQLMTQYEREKQLRKSAETKLLEQEDTREEEQKKLQRKVESLETIVRMLELKSKNASDHVFRLEEKENELRKDYTKLHDRYTELLRVHMDHLERSRMVMGNDRLESFSHTKSSGAPSWNLNVNLQSPHSRSSGPLSFGFQSLENANGSILSSKFDFGTSTTQTLPLLSLGTEMNRLPTMTDLEMSDDHSDYPSLQNGEAKSPSRSVWSSSNEKEDVLRKFDTATSSANDGKSLKRKEERHGNTLYQEISFQEPSLDSSEGTDSDADEAKVDPDKKEDNLYGMGKEVENLIRENNELLATKNALNIVKDDLIAKVDELSSEQEILREEVKSLQTVRNRMRLKIEELEAELKNLKEELETARKATKSDDEEDVPLSQRKRFTRVEMARVLMERNQYKEKWMELQEAVRWTEMLRAQKSGQQEESTDRRQRQPFWKFFSNLFNTNGSSERSPKQPSSPIRQSQTTPSLHFHTQSGKVTPGAPQRQNSEQAGLNKIKDSAGPGSSSVKAHVSKQDGRLQAYGWSLPSKSSNGSSPVHGEHGKAASQNQAVPVPIYCRPLEDQGPGMKIWGAAGIDISGGQTPDGGSMVGSSVFYNAPPITPEKEEKKDAVQSLAAELEASRKERQEAEEAERKLSSLVWILSSVTGKSRVTIVDANSPGDLILSFDVQLVNALCIASVPGVKETDYEPPATECGISAEDVSKHVSMETRKSANNEDLGKIEYVSCATADVPVHHTDKSNEADTDVFRPVLSKCRSSVVAEAAENITEGRARSSSLKFKSGCAAWTEVIKDGLSEPTPGSPLASSALPTVWIGCQCGKLFLHSAVLHWKKPLAVVKLPDAALAIVHIRGRVMVALANGCVAIFARGSEGTWNLDSYWLLQLAAPTVAIRCLVRVHSKIWAAFKNKVAVIDPVSLQVQHCFEAHPRKESQIRHLCWAGDGVWICVRLDSTIRLFHAHDYKHLQDVDIEPYVSKMLGTGKLGFSFVRITSMLISLQRLWIGTGNGVIISIPLSETGNRQTKSPAEDKANSQADEESSVTVYSDPQNRVYAGSFIPYCSLAQAQLSFHGHKDAVKFFVAVPGKGGLSTAANSGASRVVSKQQSSMLILSGGEGYVDFRQEPEDTQETASHLIVWQLTFTSATTTTNTTNTTTAATTTTTIHDPGSLFPSLTDP